MNLIENIKSYIQKYNLIPDNSTIIVGLSGGPDSVFLLHLLKDLQKEKSLKLIAAHLDHEWRDDSAKDEQFCRVLAESLDVMYVGDVASKFSATEKFGGSKEEFGRRLRRKFFEALAEEYNADAIALAHHLDDQEETFFIRLIRGTSLSGLTCMKPKHDLYVRPLLEVQKKDIVAWLDEHAIEYLIDPTNVSQDFLRNRIRANVIPALRECDSRFDNNFLSTLLKLQAADRVLDKVTKDKFELISEDKNKINLKKLFTFDPYLQKRILMHWLIKEDVPFTPQDAFFDEILRFLAQPGSKTHLIHQKWGIKKVQDTAQIIKGLR